MTTTITMPNALNQALSEVAQQSMAAAVAALAAKYGFDVDEARRHLELDNVKFVKKRGPSPKSQAEKNEAKAARAAAKKGEKKAKKPKAKGTDEEEAEKPKTKRGKTGYLMFAADARPEIKVDLTAALEDDEKLKPQDVIREIAKRWKALSEEAQQQWKDQAVMAMAEDSE